MNVNNTTPTSENTTSAGRSVFFCPQVPVHIWDLNNTTFSWILVLILFVASAATVLLNSLIIAAVKKKKELQKNSNILLCSMAVTDLLTGAITMPLSATINALILSRASFDHTCTLDILVNKPMIFILSSSSLHHLTAIAWEKYMAIHKWIDYKLIVTKSLLKKLVIIAWVLAVFIQVPTVVMVVNGVDLHVLLVWFVVKSLVIVGCLIAIAYFYIMVFLGVRKNKQISLVTALIKAKFEAKVGKTSALLTAAVVFSFVPIISVALLANIVPVLRLSFVFRLAKTLMLLNSLLSPVLYCYRDRHFLLAALDLLGMRKSPQVQLPVDAARFSRRKHPAEKFPQRMTRSASNEPANNIDETPKISLKRSMSDPTQNKYGKSSLANNFKQQQPSSSIVTTRAVIHNESAKWRKPRNNKLEGKIHPALPNENHATSSKRSQICARASLARSKSWNAMSCGKVSNSWQNMQPRKIRRPATAPSYHHTR